MIHKNFEKTIKKILIDKEMSLQQLANEIDESKQNLNQKLKRQTIRLLDVEKILDALDYEIIIKEKQKE